MIIDLVMALFTALLTGIVGLLPSWEIPGSITSFGAELGASVGSVNGVFPVGTLGACLGIMVGARIFVFTWGIVVWVYEHLPFKAT